MTTKEKIQFLKRKKELIKIQDNNPADANLKEIVDEEMEWIARKSACASLA